MKSVDWRNGKGKRASEVTDEPRWREDELEGVAKFGDDG